jgi:ABC-type uncharacterized transport system permease subunit
MDNIKEQLLELFGSIISMLLLGFLYKWCWNETMPYLFGLPTITYWKMVGLHILTRALFGKVVDKR